jgi:hypothetical protein
VLLEAKFQLTIVLQAANAALNEPQQELLQCLQETISAIVLNSTQPVMQSLQLNFPVTRLQQLTQERDASHLHFHAHELQAKVPAGIVNKDGIPQQMQPQQLDNTQRFSFLLLVPGIPACNKYQCCGLL